MNIIEDYVFQRRRHINRRIDPKRDRHEHRNRQHKKSIRRRRREIKISWHRRQEMLNIHDLKRQPSSTLEEGSHDFPDTRRSTEEPAHHGAGHGPLVSRISLVLLPIGGRPLANSSEGGPQRSWSDGMNKAFGSFARGTMWAIRRRFMSAGCCSENPNSQTNSYEPFLDSTFRTASKRSNNDRRNCQRRSMSVCGEVVSTSANFPANKDVGSPVDSSRPTRSGGPRSSRRGVATR